MMFRARRSCADFFRDFENVSSKKNLTLGTQSAFSTMALRLSKTIIGGVLSRSSRACFASRSNAAFAPAALAGLAPMSRRHMSLKDMDQATVAKVENCASSLPGR
jgi:hypothetical protein